MMHGNCKCFHHIVSKVLGLLAWVAGILFFWGSLSGRMFWGFDPGYWAWSVIILVLLMKTGMVCGCCGKGKMMSKMDGNMGGMCKHEMGCTCGDCDRCR